MVLTRDEVWVLQRIYTEKVKDKSDYSKVSLEFLTSINRLKKMKFVDTGNRDGFTVNVWLTPKGERAAKKLVGVR
jgi:Mn-dependent DtxR family transcriptional regulator